MMVRVLDEGKRKDPVTIWGGGGAVSLHIPLALSPHQLPPASSSQSLLFPWKIRNRKRAPLGHSKPVWSGAVGR